MLNSSPNYPFLIREISIVKHTRNINPSSLSELCREMPAEVNGNDKSYFNFRISRMWKVLFSLPGKCKETSSPIELPSII